MSLPPEQQVPRPTGGLEKEARRSGIYLLASGAAGEVRTKAEAKILREICSEMKRVRIICVRLVCTQLGIAGVDGREARGQGEGEEGQQVQVQRGEFGSPSQKPAGSCCFAVLCPCKSREDGLAQGRVYMGDIFTWPVGELKLAADALFGNGGT